MNIAGTIDFRRRWQPEAIAISASGRDLTWTELDDETARVAGGLRGLGVGAGDRVAIHGSNSMEWCVLALATLRLGAIVVPLNVRASVSEVAYILDKTEPRLVGVDSIARGRLTEAVADRDVTVVALDEEPSAAYRMCDLVRSSERAGTVEVEADAPALIPFTSGTTGYPKGVTLTHANVRAMAEAYSRFDGLGAHSVSLCFAPLAFNGGVTNALLGTVLVGGRLILEEFDPGRALQRVIEDRVTVMTGVPIVYESMAALAEFESADLSCITSALTGGAVVQPTLLETWAAKGVRLRQSYGLTEATGPITINPAERYLDKAHTAGVPGAWDHVRVVDSDGKDVPAGQAGEVIIRGPQVMAGYWRDPEATAATLRGGWLHTGDIGAFDDDGFLSIVDRKKDLIISGGINVYPAEIERVVGSFAGVVECAAFGVPHERWGETVAVAVRGVVDPRDLHAYARGELADYKVPRYVSVTDDPLPRSSFGKVLRREAAAQFDPESAFRTAST